MNFKFNGRIFLAGSILALLILAVIGLGATYRSHTVHSSASGEVLPWESEINLTGTNYIAYLYQSIKGDYAQYPWVVQISYLIVLLCILGVLVLAVLMSWDIYQRKKSLRMFNRLKERYYGTLSKIAKSDRALSHAEIETLINPEDITETSDSYRMKWIELFILLRADTDLKEPSVTNIRRTMELLGLSEFMESKLIYGADKEKLRVIQAARLLDLQLPDSIMAGIVNNRNVRLHKAARFYYMLINKDDPYLFFADDKMNE